MTKREKLVAARNEADTARDKALDAWYKAYDARNRKNAAIEAYDKAHPPKGE